MQTTVEQQPSAGSSAATGGASYTWHHGLSRDSQALVVILASAALAISLVGLVMMQWSLASDRAHIKDLIEASEKRTMDRATLAERESRVAQDRVTYFQTELAKKGIFINANDH